MYFFWMKYFVEKSENETKYVNAAIASFEIYDNIKGVLVK